MAINSLRHHVKKKSRKRSFSRDQIEHLLTGGVFFFTGMMLGIMLGFSQCTICDDSSLGPNSLAGTETMKRREIAIQSSSEPRFPTGLSSFLTGMTYIERDDFGRKFDMGIPLDPSLSTNSKVLLIHVRDKALPSYDQSISTASKTNSAIPLIENVDDAVENCDVMNVLLTQPESRRQCLAIMSQYSSNHLQKFMRIPDTGKDNVKEPDPKLPLRHVNRFVRPNKVVGRDPPSQKNTMAYWKILPILLASFKDSLEKLRPIAQKAVNKENNTMIVMVCNKMLTKLLVNFVCAQNSAGRGIKNILLFASDRETKDIGEGLGLATFYDEEVLKNVDMLPGLLKIRSAQLVNALGYNMLYQDVGTIWYHNPIPYLHNDPKNLYFDMIFQDNGGRGPLLAPYDVNAGFYYAKYNDRTRYFFSSLLVNGDIMYATLSDQMSFTNLMADHVAKYELRVRTLNSYDGMFLSGNHYKTKQTFFKKMLVDKSINPYIFHVTEAKSKTEQVQMLQQLGIWYVNNQCSVDKNESQNNRDNTDAALSTKINPNEIFGTCCLKEPSFTCHHRDRPSLKPCKDSPPERPNAKSFW